MWICCLYTVLLVIRSVSIRTLSPREVREIYGPCVSARAAYFPAVITQPRCAVKASAAVFVVSDAPNRGVEPDATAPINPYGTHDSRRARCSCGSSADSRTANKAQPGTPRNRYSRYRGRDDRAGERNPVRSGQQDGKCAAQHCAGRDCRCRTEPGEHARCGGLFPSARADVDGGRAGSAG